MGAQTPRKRAGDDPRRRLSRADWIAAARAAVARDGLDRLSVEALAAELSSTKGSFYWHFANRAALIEAILSQWEEQSTARIIAATDEAPAPRRAAVLIEQVFTPHDGDRLELALIAAGDQDGAGEVVGRVNRTRIEYIARLLGHNSAPASARIRARLIYAMYLGELHLSLKHEPRPQSPAARRKYLDDILAMCEAPAAS